MKLDTVYTGDLDRRVFLREGTRDRQVWADTFTGRYHLPPEDIDPPATVLDVGANIGLVSAHYQALWPGARVAAVEMDAACVEVGKQNAPLAIWRCVAVSALNGWGSYDPGAETDAYQFSPQDGANRIPSMTLRRAIEETLDGYAGLVKLDVEGAEWGILADAADWAPLVRRLHVELHDVPGAVLGEPLDGRDGPSRLIGGAVALLSDAGFDAVALGSHPHGVWATSKNP